jgi:hypothetical protein
MLVSYVFKADVLQEFLRNFKEQGLPRQSEWKDILLPLRSPSQRILACPTGDDYGLEPFGIIWLRTHYENPDDAHAELLLDLNIEMGLEQEENILDDEAVYAYGDNWSRIFEVIPERLFAITHNVDRASLNAAREYDERIRSLRSDIPAQTLDKVEFRSKLERLHFWSTVNYLFIADEKAMETGKVLVAFFDDRGRVVRSSRALPSFAEGLAGAWAEGEFYEMDEFREADIGVDYRPGGLYGPPFNHDQSF